MRRLLLLATAALVVLPACGGDDADPQRFGAQLRALNDSEVQGTVELVPREGDLLEVDIEATGLTPNRIHDQQIHGFVGGEREAECPHAEGGGLLRADEAQDSYGEAILDLVPYPTVGAEGELDWNLTLSVDPEALRPLSDRVVVLYGKTADRESTDVGRIYQPELPVACGTIRVL